MGCGAFGKMNANKGVTNNACSSELKDTVTTPTPVNILGSGVLAYEAGEEQRAPEVTHLEAEKGATAAATIGKQRREQRQQRQQARINAEEEQRAAASAEAARNKAEEEAAASAAEQARTKAEEEQRAAVTAEAARNKAEEEGAASAAAEQARIEAEEEQRAAIAAEAARNKAEVEAAASAAAEQARIKVEEEQRAAAAAEAARINAAAAAAAEAARIKAEEEAAASAAAEEVRIKRSTFVMSASSHPNQGVYMSRQADCCGHGYLMKLQNGDGQRAMYVPETQRIHLLDTTTNDYKAACHFKPPPDQHLCLHLRCGHAVENQQLIAYPDTNAWKNHFEFTLNFDRRTISPACNKSLVLGFRGGDIRLVPESASDAIVFNDFSPVSLVLAALSKQNLDTSFDVMCTNMGGDELGTIVLDRAASPEVLRREIASKLALPPTLLHIMLPSGQALPARLQSGMSLLELLSC